MGKVVRQRAKVAEHSSSAWRCAVRRCSVSAALRAWHLWNACFCEVLPWQAQACPEALIGGSSSTAHRQAHAASGLR